MTLGTLRKTMITSKYVITVKLNDGSYDRFEVDYLNDTIEQRAASLKKEKKYKSAKVEFVDVRFDKALDITVIA